MFSLWLCIKAIDCFRFTGIPVPTSSLASLLKCYVKINHLSVKITQGEKLKKKTILWPLFMDGVQLPQG